MYFDTTMKCIGEALTHMNPTDAKKAINSIGYNLYKNSVGYKNRAIREMIEAYNKKAPNKIIS